MAEETEQTTKRTIEIEDTITVGHLAEKLMLPVTTIIAELMKNGVMATVNERVDFDTAQIIVSEIDPDVELTKPEAAAPIAERPKRAASKDAESRPPVIAVMGHVDHGKTSLLDAVRGSEVVKAEAGGITQHISAYQVEHNGRMITFLDTPGHEAFAALREHGAQLTDLVIIVVAADDGIKPQTIEAIRFARKAGVKMIVAINKMDKEGADPNRVKQQLSEQDMLVEDWGGDTVTVEVSAKTGNGVDQLLDMVLLVADIEELKADTKVPGRGLVIESHMEQGRGPVAAVLVEEGTVKKGDFVVAGSTYAKVRNLESTAGKPVDKATPSMPVVITGFKALPEFGNEFNVAPNEKAARAQAGSAKDTDEGKQGDISGGELLRIISRSKELQELNVILKADVQGSMTSVIDSLKTLDTEEVAVRIVRTGIGPINENDIHLGASSSAIVYGFNVSMPPNIKQLASRDRVQVRLYKVIYELIDDAKSELSELLSPEVIEKELGRLIVRGIFKTTKTEVISGGEVTKGRLVAPARAKIFRDDEELAEVEVTGLKRGPQDTKEVLEGEMCGVSFKTEKRIDIQEGDRLEFFTRETVARSL